MEYRILDSINERTKIASADNSLYVLKEIGVDDIDMFSKLSRVDNRNIVRFFGTTICDDKFYAVEEYINAITLDDYLRLKGALDDNEAVAIAVQVCNGLKEIHKLGIVHRDINPNNIMITTDGIAKIIDFGISRTTKENQPCDTQILGTQGYTAPEQFGFRQTNSKADIYSVGVLINYMKTLALPSEKLTNGVLSEIVRKCTQIDENNRYRDIESLVSALQKKNKIKNFIRTIPGFRQGIWWHYLIAIPYYFILAFFLIFSIPIGRNIRDGVITLMVFIFGMGVPVPILTNYNSWLERFGFTANKSRIKQLIIQLVFAFISILISIAFIVADSFV